MPTVRKTTPPPPYNRNSKPARPGHRWYAEWQLVCALKLSTPGDAEWAVFPCETIEELNSLQLAMRRYARNERDWKIRTNIYQGPPFVLQVKRLARSDTRSGV